MKNKIIFAGPCSAETEHQVLSTAKEIASINKNIIYRAGIWKPRTRPNCFEGVGTAGLVWLQKVKSEYGLRTSTEVANAKHVEEALAHGIDILWIGARTTVNPFSVQEIADALKGVDVTVYIKNPVNPDAQLWVGAIERIQNAGIKNIGLIHRGFATYNKSGLRNEPMWQIPIEMGLKFPDLPMICDISHICGNRELLSGIAQKAVDIDVDGLMIETHIAPDDAWSDKEQQITPRVLNKFLKNIKWREQSGILKIDSSLVKMREEINTIDNDILQLIGARMKVAEHIGHLKKENNLPILQISRWSEILEKSVRQGEKIGLSDDFIRKYLDAIHIESINKQNKIMNK